MEADAGTKHKLRLQTAIRLVPRGRGWLRIWKNHKRWMAFTTTVGGPKKPKSKVRGVPHVTGLGQATWSGRLVTAQYLAYRSG